MINIHFLSLVYHQHHHYWQCAGLSFAKLASIIGKEGLKDDVAHAIRDPSHCASWISSALSDGKVQIALSSLLGTPELWNVDSPRGDHDVSAMEDEQPSVRHPNSMVVHPCLEVVSSGKEKSAEAFALSSAEQRALGRLSKNIYNANQRLLIWKEPSFSGANFVASLLDPTELGEEIESVVLISPNDAEDSYSESIEQLCNYFGIKSSAKDRSAALLEALDEKSILLVAKHAEYMAQIPKKLGTNEFVNLIIRCIRTRGPSQPRVLLVGDLEFDGALKREDCVDVSRRMDGLPIPRPDRLKFFMNQLRRFDLLRRNPAQFDGGGFRPKRARWQLDSDSSPELYSIDIRLRAFFASNRENLSYSDPTCGIRHLSGRMFHNPPYDVLEYIRASYLFVDKWSRSKRQTELQVLRWISTGIYWLTESMLSELRKRRFGENIVKIDDDSLESRLRNIRGAVKWSSGESENPEGESETYYQMSLALRAYIQEHWMVDAPYNRAIAHYTIAYRLEQIQNNREQLEFEFPFRPHWGRTRHYFLSETIRHLVRASKVPNSEIAIPSKGSASGFPKKPHSYNRHHLKKGGYCDPFEVERYCYEQIFHKELNGNRSLRERSRSLATRHGAYHMTAELLQLMADQADISQPSPYFPEEHRFDYHSRLGYSHLDLGNVSTARIAFSHAFEIAQKSDDKHKVFQSLIDQSLLHTIVGDERNLELAENCLEEAIRVGDLLRTNLYTEKGKHSSERSISKKISSRAAHLSYFKGDVEGAIKTYRSMDESRMPTDAAHCFIAALNQDGKSKDEELALSICLKNIFRNVSKGHQHDALGFRIALCHSLRKMGKVSAAEDAMDEVRNDIVNYGCSERTFLSFLLESGRILIEQGRFCEAFCNYLLPGVERARSRGLIYISNRLRDYAIVALDGMIQQCSRARDSKYWRDQVMMEISGKGVNTVHVDAARRHQFPIDPLASYEFGQFEVSEKLFSLRGLTEEREVLLSLT